MSSRIQNHVFQKMNKEEHDELIMLSFNGFMQYDNEGNITVMMGLKALTKLEEFENKMIEKYGDKR